MDKMAEALIELVRQGGPAFFPSITPYALTSTVSPCLTCGRV